MPRVFMVVTARETSLEQFRVKIISTYDVRSPPAASESGLGV